jgi:uncharacterized C2H2 Zn-finger protein
VEEKLKCRRCGASFKQDNVDDTLEAEELICPRCEHLFTKDDLGRRDWLHRPIDPKKVDFWIGLAAVVLAVVVNEPQVALALVLTILLGVLCAYLIRVARKRETSISIIDRRTPR